jgi:23S rRNA (guanosine2251-2'-O)-methyltransferase
VFVARGVRGATLREFERLTRAAGVAARARAAHRARPLASRPPSTKGSPRRCRELGYADPEAPFELAAGARRAPLLVALDQVTDPRNYGAIVRCAEALGAHGVVTEARRSPPLSATVAKTAAGAASTCR